MKREFRWKKSAWDNDELQYALEYNSPSQFKIEDIRFLHAEVCGENDGADWWWILEMSDGKHFLLSGGCDYTGWDCQSSIEEHGYFNSPEDCAKKTPLKDTYNRNIQNALLDQLSGKNPFGVIVNDGSS